MELAKINRLVADRLDRSTVVLAPFASMEQHGPHLPFGTDTFIGEEIARRTDAVLDGQLLLLPAVWLGNSPHHMAFAGSLTAGPDTLVETAVDVVSSILRHGFRNVLMLNAHGGNRSPLELALQKVQARQPDAQVVLVTYWHLIADEIAGVRDGPPDSMGHAGELETSVMLALDPERVGPERPAETSWGRASEYRTPGMFASGPVVRYVPFDEISETGVVGDAAAASAEKGEEILTLVAGKLAHVCRRMRDGTL